MTASEIATQSPETLVAAATRARAAYDWEATVHYSDQALSAQDIPIETACDLLEAKAEAHRHLGDLHAEEKDLEALVHLAERLGDPAFLLRCVLSRADVWARQGRLVQARRAAQSILDEAERMEDPALQAAGLLTIAMILVDEGHFDSARDHAHRAAELFRDLGNPAGQGWAVFWSSVADSRQDRIDEALARSTKALELFRSVGEREGEARALNGMGIISHDLAQKRALYEQALEVYRAVGDLSRQAMVLNNLALANERMGLYSLARDEAAQAVDAARTAGARVDLAFYLDSLARALLGLGDPAQAGALAREGLALAREIGDVALEANYTFGLARAEHASGRPLEACALYSTAADLFGRVDVPAEQATCLGWLGIAQAELGSVAAALDSTARAVSLPGQMLGAAVEYPLQDPWWFRFQVLLAASSGAGSRDAPLSDEAWRALDRARETMLVSISGLSDDGLRRNYLNKVPINRRIVEEWLHEAARRGEPMAPLTDALAPAFVGQEQFRRMLDLGLRLNARRESRDLARSVVDKVVELTGAERVVLYRLDDAGDRWTAAEFAVQGAAFAPELSAWADEALLKRAALLRYAPADAPELEQRSVLCTPLVAAGRIVGLIYAEMAGIYGRMTRHDQDLLTLLANQAAVALENAAWAESLERRVAERTAELQEANAQLGVRTAELEIINRVGTALARQLDSEAIVALVGERMRDVFPGQMCSIALYDRDTDTIRWPYFSGFDGLQMPVQPSPRGPGLTSHVIESRQSLVLNSLDEARDYGAVWVYDDLEREPKSWIGVPILVADEATGVLAVQDLPENRYTDSDARLLATLASSMGVALENARLFAEASRLLDQSRQRTAELAALAKVGRQISATLDLPVVLDRIAGQACEQLAAGTGAVYLLQPDGRTLKAIACSGTAADAVLADESQLGLGIIGSIVQSGVAERVHDTLRDARGLHIPGTDDTGAGEKLMVAPLLVQERAIGALAVWRDPEAPIFNDAELSFAVGLAQQAAVAIENARLFEAAQESQRRMADIIDFLPDATLVIDRNGHIIAWNRAIEEMTGVQAEEMLGKGSYEYAIPFYGERRPILIDLVLLPHPEVEKRYAQLERYRSGLMGEALVPVLRGKSAYLYATASALRNSRGDVVGAIETIRDISDRKLAEEELRQAKAAAESATRAKSDFLATMSHEIRTPMNAVIGMTSLLLDTPLSSEQREFAETIRSSGDALLAIINDILDFSKIEAKRIELECRPLDVHECVESALSLVAGQAAAKGLELGCWIDSHIPTWIAGDEARLRQIVLNLLSNAVKFTDQGEVEVTVRPGDELPAAAEDPSSTVHRPLSTLHFSVRDTGLGIPADRMERLFQSFSQVDSSTTRKYGGTGLGLVISHRLVELMGGHIWVESAGIPGKGSTFHFTIRAQASAAPDQPTRETAAASLAGRRVLVVDDSATSRRVLALQVEAWGMTCLATGSPAEALGWLRRGDRFDVAVLDRQMPEMDGLMLAAEVRKLRDAHALPLVMVSSLGRAEAEVGSQFSAFLLKPVRASQLYEAMWRILGSPPPGGTAEAEAPAAPASLFDREMGERRPLRILLVEDNVVNQKLALRLLERLGYRADLAANGVEALRAVERQPYDVVFMDVQMPEMDGLEATRRICARWPAAERPRIVAMTANALREDREACLAAGMDDYLAKPIRVDELTAALRRSAPAAAPGESREGDERLRPN